jgi:hypothetical protein
MRLGKKHLVLGILVFVVGVTLVLSSKPADPNPADHERTPPQTGTMGKGDETVSPEPSVSEKHEDTKAPVRHETALEMAAALKDFETSFKVAVESNRQDFATRLILRKLTHGSQRSGVYDWLTAYMDANDFLWQNPELLHVYWSYCVSSRCDQKEFKSRLAVKNQDYLRSQADCMDSWADLMMLVEKANTVTDIEVQGLKPKLKQCLTQNGVSEEMQTTQLQYFLGLVQMKLDRATAEAEYDALKQSFPSMPPFAEILPQ